jgi:hypothetical protein
MSDLPIAQLEGVVSAPPVLVLPDDPAPVRVPLEERNARLPPTPFPQDPWGVVDQLLRDPERFLAQALSEARNAPFIRTLLLTITGSAAALGATMGAYHGGLQIVAAAVKLPVVVLLTAAICTPALSALNAGLTGRADIRRDATLVLTALAFGTLLAAGLSPLLLMAASRHFHYHRTILLLVSVCLLAGAMGLSVFLAGLRDLPGRLRSVISLLMLTVITFVGAQMSWMLRPYIGRPGVPLALVRSVDDDLVPSLQRSVDSARRPR